jgi:hypothetical protein
MFPIDFETEEVDVELARFCFVENPQDRYGFLKAHSVMVAKRKEGRAKSKGRTAKGKDQHIRLARALVRPTFGKFNIRRSGQR